MYCGGTDIGAVVADIGSSVTRIGFAGEDSPRAYFPSSVGIVECEAGRTDKQYYFDIDRCREGLMIENPMQSSLVTNWDLMEKIWEHSMSYYLKVDTKETPVLLSEKCYNSSQLRQKMCEMMFEKYNAPAVFISKDAVLSCFSCGRTSGLVVDCGGSGTVITPVNDGWVELKGVSRSVIGGRYMDAHMQYVLAAKSIPVLCSYQLQRSLVNERLAVTPKTLPALHATYESYMRLELLRDMKESISRVADSSVAENDPRFLNLPLLPYELPDGTVVDIGPERFSATELLFDPSACDLHNADLHVLGLDVSSPNFLPYSTESIPKLIMNSALRCDHDFQANLVNNIVVCGGVAAVDGLPDRIRVETERLIHSAIPSWRVRTISPNNNERPLCAWLGGSIVASLGSFHEMWFSRQEYDEYGPGLIDKKCP